MSDSLFLDQDFRPTFEKIAMPVKLSDTPDNWQREIASEVFKQLPYLADFAVNVVLDRVDAQRGYAFGSAEVTNITDAPIPDQPQNNIHVPLIVKDRLLQPLDVMLDGKEALPLNERRLREKLFRTDAFETSTRKPTDQGMVDQLYPPMRTNYGYGNSVSTGVGVGGFGKQAAVDQAIKNYRHDIALSHDSNRKRVLREELAEYRHLKQASLCELIAPTISERQYDGFVNKVASDHEVRLMLERNQDFFGQVQKIAAAEHTTTEKTAQALVQSIRPTVVQFTKLASGNFLMKWANANAFMPQEAQVNPAQAGAMTGQDMSSMQPGQSMTVTTQRAKKETLDEPAATPITEFGDYTVKNADTGESMVGTVLPVVDFQMQPLELFVFTNGAGAYGMQDQIVGIRQDGPGGMALQQQEAAAPPMPQDPAAQPPAPGGMPKMAGIGRHVGAVARGAAGRLLDPIDDVISVAHPTTDAVSRSRSVGSLGAFGAASGATYAAGRHSAEHEKTAGAPPQGDGIFVYMPQGGGKPFCTLPLTVVGISTGPDGGQQIMATDVFGAELNLILTPGLLSFEQMDEDGTVAIPDDMQWVPLQGEPIHLDKGDSSDPHADAKSLGSEVAVKSTGPGEVSMDGMPLAKVARDRRWFLKTAEAEFLLCGMGLLQDEARAVIKEACSRKSGVVKLAGMLPIVPLAEVRNQMLEKAASLLKEYDYDFWHRDTVKEAAALEDSETADKVLAMNFINPENIGIFASYLPELDGTSAKLAEMLLAARLGMNQVPEGAAERAMKNLEEVIQGLRALQQKQLI